MTLSLGARRCWCGLSVVGVTLEETREGRTQSCGEPFCHRSWRDGMTYYDEATEGGRGRYQRKAR